MEEREKKRGGHKLGTKKYRSRRKEVLKSCAWKKMQTFCLKRFRECSEAGVQEGCVCEDPPLLKQKYLKMDPQGRHSLFPQYAKCVLDFICRLKVLHQFKKNFCHHPEVTLCS